jgi:hypothetical protein
MANKLEGRICAALAVPGRAYEAFKADFLKNVPAEDMAPKEAEEFGRRYLELLRAMVKRIEIGGGAAGGRA